MAKHAPSNMTHRPRCRGAVMVETVLVLPFIMLIISMLVFFGWRMVDVHNTNHASRYVTWRRAASAPGPRLTRVIVLDQDDEDQWIWDGPEINTMQFADNAENIRGTTSGYFPAESRQLLIDTAGGRSADAGDYAQTMVARLPRGQTVELQTTLASDIPLWRRLERPIRHRSTKLNGQWRYANGITQRRDGQWIAAGPRVTPGQTVRDVFLIDLDEALQEAGNQASGLTQAIRRAYLRYPGYVGPDVDYQFPSP